MELKKITVIGAGLMGSGIAQVCAQAGFEVTLRDIEDRLIRNGLDSIEKSLARFIKGGEITDEEARMIIKRIKPTTDLEKAVGDADLVIEAVPEELEIKLRVFKEVDGLCQAQTILASNTSAIMITDIASATKRPEKVIGMHWFYPAPIMKLIEVIKGVTTSDETCETIKQLSVKLGKDPVLVSDGAGFFTTRYIDIWVLEAIRMFESGVAGIAEIDKMSKLAFGWPMGPIELADVLGLDTTIHACSYIYKETGDPRFFPPLTMKKLVKSGYVGRKPGSKGGYYEYFKIEREKK